MMSKTEQMTHHRVAPLPGNDPLLLIGGVQPDQSWGDIPLPVIPYVCCMEHGSMAHVSHHHAIRIVTGNLAYGAGSHVIDDEEDQARGHIHVAGHDCVRMPQGYQQMVPIKKLGLH